MTTATRCYMYTQNWQNGEISFGFALGKEMSKKSTESEPCEPNLNYWFIACKNGVYGVPARNGTETTMVWAYKSSSSQWDPSITNIPCPMLTIFEVLYRLWDKILMNIICEALFSEAWRMKCTSKMHWDPPKQTTKKCCIIWFYSGFIHNWFSVTNTTKYTNLLIQHGSQPDRELLETCPKPNELWMSLLRFVFLGKEWGNMLFPS